MQRAMCQQAQLRGVQLHQTKQDVLDIRKTVGHYIDELADSGYKRQLPASR
jgi:hypothetical protein